MIEIVIGGALIAGVSYLIGYKKGVRRAIAELKTTPKKLAKETKKAREFIAPGVLKNAVEGGK